MTEKLQMLEIKKTIQAVVVCGTYNKAHLAVHHAVGTMTKIKQQAQAVGLEPVNLIGMSDDEIDKIIYGTKEPKRVMPDFAKVEELKAQNPKLTLISIHARYRKEYGVEKTYSYSRFCALRNLWLKKQPANKEAESNMFHWKGESMEADMSGDPLVWKDFQGEAHVSQLCVTTMTDSCAMYVEPVPDQSQKSWMTVIGHSYEYFNGVASKLVIDNAKPLVLKVTKNGSIVQDAIKVMCSHYGAEPWPCPPRSPKSKNRVEHSVWIAQKDIIAEKLLDGGWIAEDEADLKKQIRAKCDEINSRPMTGTNESRFDRLEQERPYLMPLPSEPFEVGEWRYARVDRRHCVKIRCDGNSRYSVPPEYVNKKVAVHLTGAHVTVYSTGDNQVIAKHDRCLDVNAPKTHLLPEHMTAKEKYSRLPKSACVDELTEKGLPQDLVEEYVDQAWENAKVGRRICKAAAKVCKEFNLKAVETAMRLCVRLRTPSSDKLRKYSRDNEARMAGAEEKENPDYTTPVHGNIRNNYK